MSLKQKFKEIEKTSNMVELSQSRDQKRIMVLEHKANAIAEYLDARDKEAVIDCHQLEDGWIAWNGGECPVEGDIEVEYLCRDLITQNELLAFQLAKDLRWKHGNSKYDIIAYRLHKQKEEPKKSDVDETNCINIDLKALKCPKLKGIGDSQTIFAEIKRTQIDKDRILEQTKGVVIELGLNQIKLEQVFRVIVNESDAKDIDVQSKPAQFKIIDDRTFSFGERKFRIRTPFVLNTKAPEGTIVLNCPPGKGFDFITQFNLDPLIRGGYLTEITDKKLTLAEISRINWDIVSDLDPALLSSKKAVSNLCRDIIKLYEDNWPDETEKDQRIKQLEAALKEARIGREE